MSAALTWAKNPPYRIRCSGVRTEADVWAVSEAAVDAVGISFDPADPHCVDAEQGDHLQHVAHICGLTTVCGIATDSIDEAFQRCVRQQAEVVELHGDQSPEFLAELTRRGTAEHRLAHPAAERPYWWATRVFAVGPRALTKVDAYVAECQKLGAALDAVVIGTPVDVSVDARAVWEAVGKWPGRHAWPGLVLACGLTAENVASAIRAARPTSVAARRGVEDFPGVKSPERMKAFSLSAKRAFRECRTR